MSSTAAEATKTAENTFRDLQIAAMNELALYCEAMQINVYDVRTGVDSLKGEGITRSLLAGSGVGGHCLTKELTTLNAVCRYWEKTFSIIPKMNHLSLSLPGRSTILCPPICSVLRLMR